ncbi:MAG: outer-membrane lipoprotein carrier protein LolA [Clostridia bacterium]|nr:outer-membrane lipoprotein carrier protein LolA [Clostridia bacterium]
MNIKKYIIIVTGLLIFGLTSCSEPTPQEIMLDVQKYINDVENYYCEVDVIYRRKVSVDRYKMKQWYYFPDKYRIEIIQPEVLKGKLTICDGNRILIYHPYIDEEYLIDYQRGHENERLFLGNFAQHFMDTEQVDMELTESNQSEYMVLRCTIPGQDKNFSSQRLWFDLQKDVPSKLEIIDNEDQPSITIIYNQIQVNIEMNDELFDINHYKLQYDEPVQKDDISVREAERIVGFEIAIPRYLPQGFYMQSINCIAGVNNRNIVIINYGKDRKTLFSIVQYKQNVLPAIAVDDGSRWDVLHKWNSNGVTIEVKSEKEINDLSKIVESMR